MNLLIDLRDGSAQLFRRAGGGVHVAAHMLGGVRGTFGLLRGVAGQIGQFRRHAAKLVQFAGHGFGDRDDGLLESGGDFVQFRLAGFRRLFAVGLAGDLQLLRALHIVGEHAKRVGHRADLVLTAEERNGGAGIATGKLLGRRGQLADGLGDHDMVEQTEHHGEQADEHAATDGACQAELERPFLGLQAGCCMSHGVAAERVEGGKDRFQEHVALARHLHGPCQINRQWIAHQAELNMRMHVEPHLPGRPQRADFGAETGIDGVAFSFQRVQIAEDLGGQLVAALDQSLIAGRNEGARGQDLIKHCDAQMFDIALKGAHLDENLGLLDGGAHALEREGARHRPDQRQGHESEGRFLGYGNIGNHRSCPSFDQLPARRRWSSVKLTSTVAAPMARAPLSSAMLKLSCARQIRRSSSHSASSMKTACGPLGKVS